MAKRADAEAVTERQRRLAWVAWVADRVAVRGANGEPAAARRR